jgi:thiol-disulfide isomerase/thioredoxin
MLKKILFFAGVFILCASQTTELNDKWVIDLKQETNDSIILTFSHINPNLASLDRVPIYKEKVIRNYTGVPVNDSIAYYVNNEEGLQFYWDLYKAKEYDKADFLNFVKKINMDTLHFSPKPIKQGFVSIVGFYKNKQFIIADVNRNQRFDDDNKYEFDINYRKHATDSLEVLNKLPLSDYSYEFHYKGNIQKYNRKIILFPSLYLIQSQLNNKQYEYLSSWRFKDYWKGEQTINKITYEFYYQARDNYFGAVYIKPKTISFSKDESFNDQFKHYSNDTIAIGDGYFQIDSINRNISKLYLRKVKENKGKYGQEIGSYFKNRIIEDLDNGYFDTHSILKKRKYTLIDFWGTWCEPCLRMIPKVVELHNKFPSELSIISVASDIDKNKVKEHVLKSNMNWTNGFVDRNKKNIIFADLAIQAYPTFILLDSNGKILMRGSSITEFNKIEKIIK